MSGPLAHALTQVNKRIQDYSGAPEACEKYQHCFCIVTSSSEVGVLLEIWRCGWRSKSVLGQVSGLLQLILQAKTKKTSSRFGSKLIDARSSCTANGSHQILRQRSCHPEECSWRRFTQPEWVCLCNGDPMHMHCPNVISSRHHEIRSPATR